MSGIKNKPPLNEEIELTLLGPGYGESVVIHIGDNKWIIIDSCIDSGSCAPLNYLNLIGVSPANVTLIVASHWHDDHVKGMSDLVKACSAAKFCCSTAFNTDEVIAYITSYNEIDSLVKSSSGVRELYQILETLRIRQSPPPIHASINRRILSLNNLSHSHCCDVWTLSPSDQEIKNFIADIKNITPIENEIQTIAPKPHRNNLSVVVQVSIGNEILLLGSDLEQTTDNLTGWNVIVASQEKPQGKAKIFKIPHHGSVTGHSDEVWKQLIDENPFAILTPYNRGKKLPTIDDVNRISSYTVEAYSTVSLNKKEPLKKRHPKIQEKIDDTIVGLIRPIAQKVGMLRLRKKINSQSTEWNLEKFDGGCHISEIHT